MGNFSVLDLDLSEAVLVGVAIEFKNEAWNPEVPEVIGGILDELLEFFVSEFNVGLTKVGGGEELESSFVKELNNSDIFSLSTDKFPSLLVGAFCKDSSNWEICASASAVSRLSWDLKTGVLVLGPALVIGLNLGIAGSVATVIELGLDLLAYSLGKLMTLAPHVVKSKCSGCKTVSPVLSKKALSSFLDLKRFPVGPMMKTS